VNQPTMYMYRYKPWTWWQRKWKVHTNIGNGAHYMYCKHFDVTKCTNDIHVWNGKNWIRDRSVSVKLGCNDRLITDDCFDDEQYEDNLCVFNNNSLWDSDSEEIYNEHAGYRDFKLFDEYCSNHQKIFSHKTSEGNGTTYYLHFDDSNITEGRWIITKDHLLATPETFCEYEDLAECIGDSWGFEDVDGDALRMYYDEHMKVHNMNCAQLFKAADSQNEEGAKWTVYVAIIGIVIVVVGCVIAVIWFYLYKKKMKHIMDGGDIQELGVDYKLMDQ